MSQHRISVVCLDMAGTTVKDDGVVMAAFTDALTSFNLPVAEFNTAMKYVRATMGQSKIEVFRHILGSEGAAQAANAAFEAHYAASVSGGEVAAIPGAEALFEQCRSAGIKVCLSTGFSPATRDALIAELGWGSLVDLVLSPADAGRGRPWHELAVAGDTTSDVESGLRAGAGIVAGVLTGESTRAELEAVPSQTGLPGSALILDSIADLLPHLS